MRLRCRLRLRQRFGVGQVVAVGGWRLRLQFWVEDEVGVEVDREIGLEVWGGGRGAYALFEVEVQHGIEVEVSGLQLRLRLKL